MSARRTRFMALEPRNRALFTENVVHMAVQTHHPRPNSRIVLADETRVTDCCFVQSETLKSVNPLGCETAVYICI